MKIPLCYKLRVHLHVKKTSLQIKLAPYSHLSYLWKLFPPKSRVLPLLFFRAHSCLQLAFYLGMRAGMLVLPSGTNKSLFIVADIKMAEINCEVNTPQYHLARILIQNIL